MDDVQQVVTGWIVAGLRVANGLLPSGHESPRCLAATLRPEGGRVCVVADEADFVPVLAGLSGTTQVVGSTCPDEQAPGAECLGVGADDDDGPVAARLPELPPGGEIVATAVVEAEPDGDHSTGPPPTVWLKLEHRSGWAPLETQQSCPPGRPFRA